MKSLYNIYIHILFVSIKIVSLFNKKAALWINGRNTQKKILSSLKLSSKKIVWMHCASLGEYEQGKPVLEKIKINYPDCKTVISFFSPSGYEIKKNSKAADYIFYLPIDKKNEVIFWLNIINPSLIIWVKYEYWYNMLNEIKKRNIPNILISARFDNKSMHLKWYGKFWLKMLSLFKHIFIQDNNSYNFLLDKNIKQISVIGDTRFDTVFENKTNKNLPDNLLKINFERILIIGSSWPDDIDILCKVQSYFDFCIIAPHNIDEKTITHIESKFLKPIRFSQHKENVFNKNSALIIDSIGLLSSIYKLGTISYIGGGFNASGIHNTLEACVWGKPVLFGPNFDKFIEAKAIFENQNLGIINSSNDLKLIIEKLFSDNHFYKKICSQNEEYINKNIGASNKILNYIQMNNLLTIS